MSKHDITVQRAWLDGHLFEEVELSTAIARARVPEDDPVLISAGRTNVLVALDVDSEHHNVYVDLVGGPDNIKTLSRAIEVLRDVRNALEAAERG